MLIRYENSIFCFQPSQFLNIKSIARMPEKYPTRFVPDTSSNKHYTAQNLKTPLPHELPELFHQHSQRDALIGQVGKFLRLWLARIQLVDMAVALGGSIAAAAGVALSAFAQSHGVSNRTRCALATMIAG